MLQPAWSEHTAAQDLATFIREAWPVLQPARPMVWSWHYDLLCEYLTLVKDRMVRRLLINVPPRTAKSTIATICFPCWVWATEPGHTFLCASYSRELSTEHSVARRNLIMSPWYQQRWGKRFSLASDQNLKTQFDNNQRGQMIATSVGATATGKGGDTLIVDDPLSADQALSDAERKTANDWFDGTLRSRLNHPASGAMVVIMQRLHELDLTGFLLASEGVAPRREACEPLFNAEGAEGHRGKPNPGPDLPPSLPPRSSAPSALKQGHAAAACEVADKWTHLKLPLEAEEDERWEYPISHQVHVREKGEILQPERFTPAVVAALKSRSLIYAGQYQQRPAPLEGNLIKRQQVRYYGGIDPLTGQADEPLPAAFDLQFLSADCSFKDRDSSDFVAIGRIGVKGRKRYLLNVLNAHLGMSATEAHIRREREGRSISAILIEDKANGSAVIECLRRNVPGVVPVNPQGGKLARFMAAAPEWEAGDWYVDRNAAWTEPLIQQLTSFPNAAHDDMADMMSQASIWLQTRGGGIVSFWQGSY
jgi:predicted phage terminase large subunit-like protein